MKSFDAAPRAAERLCLVIESRRRLTCTPHCSTFALSPRSRGVAPSRAAQRLTAALQEAALGCVLASSERGLVRQRCVLVAAQAAEQVGADGVKQVIAIE